MMDEHERDTPAQPAPIQDDGWWHTIIDALLEEFDGRRKDLERGPGQ